MDPIVKIIDEKCQVCWACVRACPVKAIRIKDENRPPEVMPSRCVACGSCIEACHVDAIEYRQTASEAMDLLKNNKHTIALVSPSISGEFDDITDVRKLVSMIRALGFRYVTDVAFGVDLVARRYAELFSNTRGKYYITSHCPVTYAYIEKYHPDMVANLTPLVTPMIAAAKVARRKFGSDAKIIYISPNISAKMDAERSEGDGKVDCVITFSELRDLFEQADIIESRFEYSEFDGPLGYRGLLSPISNGILQAGNISEDLVDGNVFTVSGKKRLLNAVKAYEENIDEIRKHFNLVYEDSLNNPGSTRKYHKLTKEAMVVDYTKRRLKSIDKSKWELDMHLFSDLDLSFYYRNNDQRLVMPKEEDIKRIMKGISIMSGEEELNCTSCGYSSCKDFAIAVNQGLTTINMCTTFSIRSKQNYIQKLRQTNETLVQMQEALRASEKESKTEHDKAIEVKEIMTNMMQKLRSGVVIVDNQYKIIHSNPKFIAIIGQEAQDINEVIPGLVGANVRSLIPQSFQTLLTYVLEKDEAVIDRDIADGEKEYNISVFSIKKNKFVGAIVRDLHMPEIQRAAITTRISEVINKNLSMVQQIGYILGESASESEEMLRSINDILDVSKKQKADGK